jgi:hypothetical protein
MFEISKRAAREEGCAIGSLRAWIATRPGVIRSTMKIWTRSLSLLPLCWLPGGVFQYSEG